MKEPEAGQNREGGQSGEVPVAQLGPALLRLRAYGLPVGRIADVFGIKRGYARQLLHRENARWRLPVLTAREDALKAGSYELAIRRDENSAGPSRHRDERVERLLDEVEHIRHTFASSGEFLEAADRLKRLQQFAGFPSHPSWLRYLARVFRERAWFLVHSGHTVSAIHEARKSMVASRYAFRQARSAGQAKRDLQAIVDAGLLVSHAHLLRRSSEALGALVTVEQAAEAGRLRLGSDYYRQRGVYLLQAGGDEPAQRYFDKSARIMEELAESTHGDVELRYTGARHTNLLMKNWDAAFELVHDARHAFGSTSLHASVSSHWAVACGLSTDSQLIRQEAMTLLDANAATARAFGHQHTLLFLFERTPDLHLSIAQQADWVRFALYINAYKNR